MKIIAIIPARGGSKGIPRKNVRFIAGKPLMSYVIESCKKCDYVIDAVVSSDDDEIQTIAKKYGALVIERPAELATDEVTLDPVVNHAVCEMEKIKGYKYDIVITVQPTSPLLSAKTLNKALTYFLKNSCDTLISSKNDAHLSWKKDGDKWVPNYLERKNRQYLPREMRETGAFVITRRMFVNEKTRFGKNVDVFEVPSNEAIDIDTAQDWWVAECELKKKNILIRLDGYSAIGMGHIYRGLQLASGLIEHNVRFVISSKSDVGIQKIQEQHYPFDVIVKDEEIYELIDNYEVDIVINDILNTSEEYMVGLNSKGVRIVNFEDEGPGASLADEVINALYEGDELLPHRHYGSDYYLIRDEFAIQPKRDYSDRVEEVLIVFGGTDPSDLTQKTLLALKDLVQRYKFHLTIILGLGYQGRTQIEQIVEESKYITVLQNVQGMAEHMGRADLAIASQGRTMLELAAMGVPTILMSENERESSHEFGSIKNGFLNLGVGDTVAISTIQETVNWLMNCPQIRKNMRDEMLKIDLMHGFARVKSIILGEQI